MQASSSPTPDEPGTKQRGGHVSLADLRDASWASLHTATLANSVDHASDTRLRGYSAGSSSPEPGRYWVHKVWLQDTMTGCATKAPSGAGPYFDFLHGGSGHGAAAPEPTVTRHPMPHLSHAVQRCCTQGVAVLLLGGGYFAGAIWRPDAARGPGLHIVHHRAHKAYVVRRGQGSRQAGKAAQRQTSRARSAGGRLRAKEERKLEAAVLATLQEWAEPLARCGWVFVHAPGPTNAATVFHPDGPLTKADVHRVPIPARRATFAEVKRVFSLLTRVRIDASLWTWLRAQAWPPCMPRKGRKSKRKQRQRKQGAGMESSKGGDGEVLEGAGGDCDQHSVHSSDDECMIGADGVGSSDDIDEDEDDEEEEEGEEEEEEEEADESDPHDDTADDTGAILADLGCSSSGLSWQEEEE